ncbi:MAG: alcohol dehydrogenase catalytic domain-containing protein [Chloroflexota bacterium]
MKAWRWYAFGDFRLEEEPMPVAKPGWLLLKMRVAQASVTDAERAMGIHTGDIELIRRLIEQNAPIKMFGHELCAEVVGLGQGVKDFRVGDRVAAMSTAPCHECPACLAGYPEYCRRGQLLGRHIPGGFAEYVALPQDILVKLPESVNDNEGASIQPASEAVAGTATANIRMGDTVAVLGQGCMGNYIMQVARASGAGKVITTDVRDEALKLSKELGADLAIDARKEDVGKIILEATGGIGPDIVFESAGGSPKVGLAGEKTLGTAFDVAREGGTVVQIAFFDADVTMNLNRLRRKGIKYLFLPPPSRKLLQHTVDLVASKRLKLTPLITHVLEGLDKVPQAIDMSLNKAKYKLMNPAQVVVSRG